MRAKTRLSRAIQALVCRPGLTRDFYGFIHYIPAELFDELVAAWHADHPHHATLGNRGKRPRNCQRTANG